jgi:NAD(P)-dependent dehydrogenase (short-subunit alcohol dehydrogenase family)
MKQFENKVAVITGAASGIGLALAYHCAREKMKIVLADVEEEALSQAENKLRDLGASSLLAVKTDVSQAAEVSFLAEKALDQFGQIDLLFNNAGVACGVSTIWESTEADWQWVLGVNLFGVVNGLRTFVPIMLQQDTEAHIINVASIAGMMAYYFNAPYHVSKCAVVALSEQLYFSLAMQESKIKTSVLCPGYIRTNILTAERNRPGIFQNKDSQPEVTPQTAEIMEQVKMGVLNGAFPEELAQYTFEAIRADQFYILPHPKFNTLADQRCADILQRQNPDVRATMDLFSNPDLVKPVSS